MLSHFVAVCLALLPFAQCIPIHEHMTKEEVSKTFQTGHDNVPGYEVVRIYHTLHKRDVLDDSTRVVKFNTPDRNVSLDLKPNKGLLVGESTPVWTVVENLGRPNGTKYLRNRKVLANIGKAYHGVSKRSAIVAYEGEDGETLIHGTVLENLIVRPLPYRLHNIILRERRDLVDLLPDGVEGNTDFQRSHHHVVFKRPERDINATHDGIRVVERERMVSRRSDETPTDDLLKAIIPTIIYPEILIIVDFYLYEAIGKSVEEAVRYVLAFWNSVDLGYVLLETPVVRLNIAGIVISVEPRGTPFLENAKRGSTKIEADLSIEAMGRYLYTESYRFPFDSYDFAVAMTRLDIVLPNGDTGTVGVSYHAGACTRNNLTMATTSVAILEDRGRFDGTMRATFGISDLIDFAKNGPAKDEQINPYYWHDFHGTSEISPYEVIQLTVNLRAPESICLRNEPRGGKALSRKLLGEFMTVEEQCKKAGGLEPYNPGQPVCGGFTCWKPGNAIHLKMPSPPQGTPCGDEKHCINGLCVSWNVKHVPNAVA